MLFLFCFEVWSRSGAGYVGLVETSGGLGHDLGDGEAISMPRCPSSSVVIQDIATLHL